MNSFLNKVSAERKVLATINNRLSRRMQLTGLSRVAISNWTSLVGINRSSELVSILTDLADACQTLSDRSNETFTSLDIKDSEKIDKKIGNLKAVLKLSDL